MTTHTQKRDAVILALKKLSNQQTMEEQVFHIAKREGFVDAWTWHMSDDVTEELVRDALGDRIRRPSRKTRIATVAARARN
jgi:hypothetical protein